MNVAFGELYITPYNILRKRLYPTWPASTGVFFNPPFHDIRIFDSLSRVTFVDLTATWYSRTAICSYSLYLYYLNSDVSLINQPTSNQTNQSNTVLPGTSTGTVVTGNNGKRGIAESCLQKDKFRAVPYTSTYLKKYSSKQQANNFVWGFRHQLMSWPSAI